MKPATLALFLRFKRQKPGSPLLYDNGEPVKDVSGKPILCQGGWNDPKIANQFAAMVTLLHQARDHTGEYRDYCMDCRALPAEVRHRGCPDHPGDPRLFRCGNPRVQ